MKKLFIAAFAASISPLAFASDRVLTKCNAIWAGKELVASLCIRGSENEFKKGAGALLAIANLQSQVTWCARIVATTTLRNGQTVITFSNASRMPQVTMGKAPEGAQFGALKVGVTAYTYKPGYIPAAVNEIFASQRCRNSL